MLDHTLLTAAIRRALVHINDPAYLESDDVLAEIIHLSDKTDISRGLALQRALRLAIDRLAPHSGDEHALDAQSYEVLYQYTLARRNMTGIALQLGMSERQGYRTLQRAITVLADVLMAENAPEPSGNAHQGSTPVRTELERLLGNSSDLVDLAAIVRQTAQQIESLAHDLQVQVNVKSPNNPVYVVGQRVLLRQALLNLIRHLIACTQPNTSLSVTLESLEDKAQLSMVYDGQAPDREPGAQSPLAVAYEIFRLLDISCETRKIEKTCVVEVRLGLGSGASILLVDDNEDMIALLRRYLQSLPYRVYSAASYDEALIQVGEYGPQVVILDIMLPGRDGWELIHMLQRLPQERRPRVVVCSVIDDPELSASLGADAFLRKPVTQRQLVEAVQTVLTGRA